jgi:hypothetical protein
MATDDPPIVAHPTGAQSVFLPENLLERAASMALAEVQRAEIAALLHVTNNFATTDSDFDKGPGEIHARMINCCHDAFAEVRGQG